MAAKRLALLALTLTLGACSAAEQPQSPAPVEEPTAVETHPCVAANTLRPACGFMNPEDLAVVPGGEKLLVSEMAWFMTNAPGALSLLDIATHTRESIDIDWQVPAERWGDPACEPPAAEKFSPHGIHLMTRPDGRHQVLAVNHGDEQIEFLELSGSEGNWGLQWRGCAKPPDDPFVNDVAGLNDGGFVVTQMWNKSYMLEEVVALVEAGETTGWVWEWQPEKGFTKLPNSDALMPNGITVNPDNTKIFVNIYLGNKHIRIDRASGEIDGEFDVQSPDNVEFGADGHLWIASHLNDPVEGRCEEGHAGPCLLPFQVIRADPETMQPEVVLTHAGLPMGYATVALPHEGWIYLGTASGDRLAAAPID